MDNGKERNTMPEKKKTLQAQPLEEKEQDAPFAYSEQTALRNIVGICILYISL
jgi:hypothetical protein